MADALIPYHGRFPMRKFLYAALIAASFIGIATVSGCKSSSGCSSCSR